MVNEAASQNPNYEATAAALNDVTDQSCSHHYPNPLKTLHKPSNHEESHSWMSKLIPTSALERLEVNWNMGNYVINRHTGEKTFESMSIYVRLGMHLLYYGSEQQNILQWKSTEALLKSQSEKMGHEYDSPSSVAHIAPFLKAFNLESSMVEMVQPDPTKYKNFNEFFAREIKESARPIAEPDNDFVSSSPADCRLTAFQTLDLARQYWIKGRGFTIGKLLGSEELAQEFEGGSIAIARLAPQDYHRWHAPVSGTVEKVYDIPGTYYTVNPQAVTEAGTLNVFCANKRSVMLLKRTSTGSRIAIIAVGAMLVGSIKYVGGCEAAGTKVRRGQCLGAFYYGGSTVIVLYPRGEIVIDADIAHNSTKEACETEVKVGWRVGAKQ